MRDEQLFRFIRERYPRAGVTEVELEENTVVVTVLKAGLLIGKEGAVLEQLRQALRALRGPELDLRLVELRRPELEAVLLADDVARKISTGSPPERVADLMAEQALRAGALGCRIVVTGAVSHQCELGAFEAASAEQFSTTAVLQPPFTVDDDGNEVAPPPSVGPPPEFEVEVSLNHPLR